MMIINIELKNNVKFSGRCPFYDPVHLLMVGDRKTRIASLWVDLN